MIEPTIGASQDVLPAYYVCVLNDPLLYKSGVFDEVGSLIQYTRNEYCPLRQT